MSAPPQSGRARLLSFAAVAALVVTLAGGYVWHRAEQAQAARQPTQGTAADRALDVDKVLAGPYIAFRSTAIGPTFGQLAVTPLGAPAGGRAATGVTCDGVYATAGTTACVAADRGVVTETFLHVLDRRFDPVRKVPINGLPNRAGSPTTGRWRPRRRSSPGTPTRTSPSPRRR